MTATTEPWPDVEADTEPPPRDLTPDEAAAVEARWRAQHRTTTAATNGHRRLPEARDAEEALLGAMLLNPQAIDDALAAGIVADAYRIPAHQQIHDAITTLHAQGDPADVVPVAEVLDRRGLLDQLGGPPRLIALQGAPAAIGSAGKYARIVLERWQLRQTIYAASDLTEIAYQGNPDLLARAIETTQARLAALATTTGAHRLAFDDVAGAMRGEVERTVPDHLVRSDGTALIYPGRLHWLMGEPGKGKTWVALYAAAQLIEITCGRVVYLDWENSRDLVADRLNTLGADPEQVAERLRYTRSPSLDPGWVATLAATIDDGPNTLAIIDGAAPSIAAGGWSERDETDVLAWLDRIVWPLCRTGAAVLVLDHVTKDRETRGLWPRGSGAKSGAVDGAAWSYRVRRPFSRTHAGHADLIQAKDREGVNGTDGAAVASFHATPDGHGGTTFELRPPPATTGADGTFRPTVLMERISTYVEQQNRLGQHPTRNDIIGTRGRAGAVKGKTSALREALGHLIDEGYLSLQVDGQTHRHRSERPFHSDDAAQPHDHEEEF